MRLLVRRGMHATQERGLPDITPLPAAKMVK